MADVPNNAPERESDIGLDEAYTVNLKTVVEVVTEHLNELSKVGSANTGRAIRNAEDHDQEIRNLATQSLADCVKFRKASDDQVLAERERTVREANLGMDRIWNVDEIAQLVANNGMLKDAIASAVVAGVNEAVKSLQNPPAATEYE